MNIIPICLGDHTEKRDALELNVKHNLELIGWKCHQGVKDKSAETDILAEHEIYPSPLYIECKAWKDPVGGDDVHKFNSKINVLNESVKFGWFIALKGYKNGVENSFKGVSNLKLFTGITYYEMLKKYDLVKPYEIFISKYHIKVEETQTLYLIYQKEKIFWLFIFEDNRFILESGTKDLLTKEDLEFIFSKFEEIALKEENKIQFCDEWEILELFFDQNVHTIEDLLKNTIYHNSSVIFHLNHLVSEKIVIKIKNEYILNDSFFIAEKIVQKCSKIIKFDNTPQIRLNEGRIFSFAKSLFFKDKLRKFTKKILKKFNIAKINKESQEIITKTIAISPSTIAYCFGEIDRVWEECENSFEIFMQTLSLLVFNDSMNLRIKLFQELSNDNKLLYINPKIEIKYALKDKLYLQLTEYPKSIVIAKLKEGHGVMLRGTPLSAADDVLLNDMGNLFMSCEQYNKSIEIFEDNIKLYPNTYGELVSVVNLMCCYLRTDEIDKVDELYLKYHEKIENLSVDNIKSLNNEIILEKEIPKIKDIFQKNYECYLIIKNQTKENKN